MYLIQLITVWSHWYWLIFFIIVRCFVYTTLILIILLAGLQNWKMQDEGAIATVNLSKLVV